MDTADRALLFMGEPTIVVVFRDEVAAFLFVTETNGTLLGRQAIGDSSFMTKLNAGASPRLSAVERIRAWMAGTNPAMTRRVGLGSDRNFGDRLPAQVSRHAHGLRGAIVA